MKKIRAIALFSLIACAPAMGMQEKLRDIVLSPKTRAGLTLLTGGIGIYHYLEYRKAYRLFQRHYEQAGRWALIVMLTLAQHDMGGAQFSDAQAGGHRQLSDNLHQKAFRNFKICYSSVPLFCFSLGAFLMSFAWSHVKR
jgi:hypothetical protein